MLKVIIAIIILPIMVLGELVKHPYGRTKRGRHRKRSRWG